MAITPADIQAQTFSEAKRGYDPGEVDVFLEQVSAEVDAMLNKIVDLKNRLTATEQQLTDAQNQLAQAQAAPAPAPAPAPVAPDYTASEARENAERIKNEADAKAREVIRQALAEKQNEIEEIDRLKASREDFKNEYMKLVQHFMDEAQNSFPRDLMSSTPTGSAAAPVAAAPAAPVAAPAPAAPVAAPAAVADPFAPIDNFGMDDLD